MVVVVEGRISMRTEPESDVIRLVERENMKKQEMLHVVCAVVVSVSIEICRNQNGIQPG